MRIIPELFCINTDGHYLVYSPFNPSLFLATAEQVAIIALLQKEAPDNTLSTFPPKFVKFLIENKFLISSEEAGGLEERIKTVQLFDTYRTKLTLFPTLDCNLACPHCYSSGGGKGRKKVLEWEHAKTAVDQIIDNAISRREKSVQITFHGGGEPTHAGGFDILKQVVEYAGDKCQEIDFHLRTYLITNGVLAGEKLEWIIQNIDEIQVSFDGPDNIHELQRPFKSGDNSFPFVHKTIKKFEENRVNYHLRATISEFNINRIEELIDYVSTETSRRELYIQPLSKCGRSYTTGIKGPSPEQFKERFIITRKYGKKRGISLVDCSLHQTPVFSYCGAAAGSFTVIPGGYLVACYEISLPTDDFADIFIVGKYDHSSGRFQYDLEKVDYLSKRTIQNIPDCRDCFAKYTCVGGCAIRVARESNGDIFGTVNYSWCDTIREIHKAQLLEKIEEQPNGVISEAIA